MTVVLWAVCFAPVAYLLQTCLHEGSHALVAVMKGGRVSRFRPWPHFMGTRFVWGSTSYGRITGGMDTWLFPMAPRLLNVAQMAIACCLGGAAGACLAVPPAVDFTVNSSGLLMAEHTCDAWESFRFLVDGTPAVGEERKLLVCRLVTVAAMVLVWTVLFWRWPL